MAEVKIRCFGLRRSAAQPTRLRQTLGGPTTVGQLWQRLLESGEVGGELGRVDREALLVLINGRPIHMLRGWNTPLADGDEVTFMLQVAGG